MISSAIACSVNARPGRRTPRGSTAAPADVVERLPRRLEAVGGLDLAALEATAGGVADRVERAELLLRPGVDLVEDGLDLLAAPVVVRLLAEDVLQLELLEQDEADVAEVGLVAVDRLGHRSLLARRRLG
jgi:hypothetical protein